MAEGSSGKNARRTELLPSEDGDEAADIASRESSGKTKGKK
jgi:hypothetical protein